MIAPVAEVHITVGMTAREKSWTAPKAIVAVYPVANSPETVSKKTYATAKPLNTPMLAWFLRHKLTSPSKASDPRLNLVAANLKGLLPTTIILAEIDPLCLAAVAAKCQTDRMFNGKRPYLIAVLGIIAMLGALLSVAFVGLPATANGLVVAHKVDVRPADADTKAMPCHKSAESCPSCLKTSCADFAVCMAKCLQKITGAAPSALVPVFLEATTLWPEVTMVLPGSLIPPLLRPPIC